MDDALGFTIGALRERNDRNLLGRIARLCPEGFSADDIERVRARVAKILVGTEMDQLEQRRMIGSIIFDEQRMLRVNLEG